MKKSGITDGLVQMVGLESELPGQGSVEENRAFSQLSQAYSCQLISPVGGLFAFVFTLCIMMFSLKKIVQIKEKKKNCSYLMRPE